MVGMLDVLDIRRIVDGQIRVSCKADGLVEFVIPPAIILFSDHVVTVDIRSNKRFKSELCTTEGRICCDGAAQVGMIKQTDAIIGEVGELKAETDDLFGAELFV
jgi:hypothetical protein